MRKIHPFNIVKKPAHQRTQDVERSNTEHRYKNIQWLERPHDLKVTCPAFQPVYQADQQHTQDRNPLSNRVQPQHKHGVIAEGVHKESVTANHQYQV